MLQKPRPGPILRVAFGFFLGAAVLAKGPAAIILAGGATLLWAALCRQWRAPFRFLHPLILIVFCATALPWYVLCALRNPDFLRVFIWQHNFERYLTPVFEHRQPFWYFGYILLLAVFPWILFSGRGPFRRVLSFEKQSGDRFYRYVFCLLGLISNPFLQPFSIEAPRIYPAGHPSTFPIARSMGFKRDGVEDKKRAPSARMDRRHIFAGGDSISRLHYSRRE